MITSISNIHEAYLEINDILNKVWSREYSVNRWSAASMDPNYPNIKLRSTPAWGLM
jgi:hypothetical protein